MHDALLVDPGHAQRRSVDQRHLGQVERRQELVVKSRPLAAIGVVGLERRSRLRVLDDRIDPGADLLHDPEVGVELLLDHLLRRQRSLMLLALLEVRDLARKIVVVALQRGPAG